MASETREDGPDPDGFTKDQLKAHDPALEALLMLVVKGHRDNASPLTVVTNGQVISGYAIPFEAWAEEIVTQMGPGWSDPEVRQRFTGAFTTVYGGWAAKEKERSERRDAAKLPPVPSAYLHMRDVRIGGGSDRDSVTMQLWRGRIDAIDGWTIGKIS
jgi:hypothetical protein